jgi:outer membrane protein OmpA-like peptidoglycan-associated protein
MTLKRYQPARKRKRPAKKNRPLKLAVALGVIGLAAGGVYMATHGELLVGLLNGSVDLPGGNLQRPAGEQAVVAAKMAAERHQAPAAAPSPGRLKTATLSAAKPAAPSPAPSATATAPAVVQAPASPRPSAFPENGQAATTHAADPTASAAPLNPAVAPVATATQKPVVKASAAAPVAAKPASPKPVASPRAVAAKPTPAPSRAPVREAAKPAAAKPVVAAKPAAQATAAPVKAAARPARPASNVSTGASLYFDKNSSYLSAAEQQRVAALAASLKQRGGTVHITGFADSLGDAKYNRWMAERRASRVAELIKSHSGGQVRVVVEAVGSVGQASGKDGEARNRRVELQVR